MLEETLYLFNPWWIEEYKPPGIKRERYLGEIEKAFKTQNIVILFGLRRVGKTTIMKQFAGINIPGFGHQRVFFASMDHPDIRDISLLDLLREFRRINRVKRDEPVLLLLDEVHYRKDFEQELKALYDTENRIRVVASGSSSLVVRHRSAAMTGRYRKIEVNPISFQEYLTFIGEKYDVSQPYLIEGFLEDYLLTGGMPQYVLTHDPNILIDLVDDIIYKDISAHYGVRDPKLLRELFFLLMERAGKPLTYSRIGRIIGVGVDAAKRYVGYFEETFLIHLVEKYGKPNVRKVAPRKCYSPDTGIKVVCAGKGNIGSLAENLVYLLIKDRGDVYYYNDTNREVDFIVDNEAIEVKYMDELKPMDIETLRGIKLRKVLNKIVITRRDVPRMQDVKPISLWRFASGIGK